MDKYASIAAKGKDWSRETKTVTNARAAYTNGRDIRLYRDGSLFGATVASEECGGIAPTCVGSTTPKAGTKALFAVQCGSARIVTNDPYVFTPAGLYQRPWICDGKNISVRPEWSLLGFFEANACGSLLNGLTYDADFC